MLLEFIKRKKPKIKALVYSLENGELLANGEIDPKTQKKIDERKAVIVKMFEQMLNNEK